MCKEKRIAFLQNEPFFEILVMISTGKNPNFVSPVVLNPIGQVFECGSIKFQVSQALPPKKRLRYVF